MKLTIILPALNESATIEEVLLAIPRQIPQIQDIQTIVINDGSTDATAEIATQAGALVISHPTPMGVGAAFHTGLEAALKSGADIIVNIDSDGQFNPQDIPALIAPVLAKKAEFVTATRFADPSAEPSMPTIKRWGNRWMTHLINLITHKKFTDVSCGFRAYSREAALRLTLFGHFTYTQESFINLAFKSIPMTEVSVPVRGEREHGRSRVAGNLWRYGIKSATIIFRAARDYQPFYFIGIPGIIMFLAGVLSGLFLTQHYLMTGGTSPYRSLVTVSGTFLIIGFLLFIVSLVADMVHRNRVLIEESLYLIRKSAYQRHEQ